MTSIFPTIFSYGTDNIKQKIDDLIALGFTEEEVKRMTCTAPYLFGYSIDNIREKVECLRKIGLGSIIASEPTRLITSVNLVWARYKLLTSRDIDVSVGHHGRLFYQQKAFIRAYGVSNEEVLKMYQYDKNNITLE